MARAARQQPRRSRSSLRIACSICLPALAAALSGCGAADGKPEVMPVSGLVTYQGKPVAGARVIFTPHQVSGRPWPGTAETDSEGKFEIRTPGLGDGAIVATHSVTIVARGPNKPLDPDSPFAQMGEAGQVYAPKGDPLIPRKYFSKETSGLTAEITTDGDNHFEFHLTD